MKKSVIILIAIIYVASIALVSFFGLKFKVFEEVVPVESVKILDENLKPGNENFDYYTVIELDADGKGRYQIQYRVYPDNATNQEVDFILTPMNSGDSSVPATIDENGVVQFDRQGAVIVSVIARDATGKDAEVSIAIMAVAKK